LPSIVNTTGRVPALVAETRRLIVAVARASNFPRAHDSRAPTAHVTVAGTEVHVADPGRQPSIVAVADDTARPAGSALTTVTPFAESGPRLLAVNR
jgi:hypothetical protein